MERTEKAGTLRDTDGAPAADNRKRRPKLTILVDSMGILAAFGIAFGGLWLMERQLNRETQALLRGSGLVEIPVQSEALVSQEVNALEIEPAMLTDLQLRETVEKFEQETDAYPHEPWEGQLSMEEAMETARSWTEEFLLASIGIEDAALQGYGANCYLWTWQKDVEEGRRDPWLGYWNVWIDTNRGLVVNLTLNAATGQVLYAGLTISQPVEYLDRERLEGILSSYADSFGLGGTYVMAGNGSDRWEDGWDLYQNVGEEGVFAAVKTSSVVIADDDGDMGAGYREIFHIDLQLVTDIKGVP